MCDLIYTGIHSHLLLQNIGDKSVYDSSSQEAVSKATKRKLGDTSGLGPSTGCCSIECLHRGDSNRREGLHVPSGIKKVKKWYYDI